MSKSASREQARNLTDKVPALHADRGPEQAAHNVMAEILACNRASPAHEDLWSRTRQAADMVRQADADLTEAEELKREADLAYKTAQAENPERSAPRLRQWLLAAGTLALDSVACYFAAQALGADQVQTLAWTVLFLVLLGAGEFALDLFRDGHRLIWRGIAAVLTGFVFLLGVLRFSFLVTVGIEGLLAALAGAGLFTVVTASFVILGYRVLRVAETGATAKARHEARKCAKAAAAARHTLRRQVARRDRLARAYLSRIRTRLVLTYTASQLPAMEQAVWTHLVGRNVA
jgi:hypothetical protein